MGDLCFQDGQTVLFIGDSITDCGRRGPAAPLGDGYVSLLAEMITARWPERRIRYINTGIGGDRVTGMKNRWQDDVIRHEPDWLSVKIGINDLHSALLQGPDAVPPERYRDCYDWILADARKKTSAQFILVEPFYISQDQTGQTLRSQVLGLIPEYIAVVRGMADKYDARLVRTHDAFQNHLAYRGADTFCPEPVHPNRAGHIVLATEVLSVLCA